MSTHSHGELDAHRQEREAVQRRQQLSDNARHAHRHYQDTLRDSHQHGQNPMPPDPDMTLDPQPSALPLVYTTGTPHENALVRLVRMPYRFMTWLLRPLGGSVRDVVVVGLILAAMVALAYSVYAVAAGI